MNDQKNGFIAYPSKPNQLSNCISSAVKRTNSKRNSVEYSTWEENDIAGRPLTAPIFKGIDDSDILIADVTILNFNVT